MRATAGTGESTFRTATSLLASAPTKVADNSRPSSSTTRNSTPPSTTCWLVTTCPSSSRMKPLPEPVGTASVAPSLICSLMTVTTAGPICSTTWVGVSAADAAAAVFGSGNALGGGGIDAGGGTAEGSPLQ